MTPDDRAPAGRGRGGEGEDTTDPPIALVSAMHEELHRLRAALPDARVVHVGGRDFHLGHLDGHPVVIVLAGIGKVAAAATCTLAFAHFGARALLFSGVAGGLAPGVSVGDVVVADALLQHDLDASPLFPRHEVPLTGVARFPTDAAWSAAIAAAAQALLPARDDDERRRRAALGITAPRLHRGLVVSGDRFVATGAESEALRRELPDALAVEMEGAAAAQVARDFGRPLAVVRSISDRADDSAHLDFGRFVSEHASHLGEALVRGALQRLARADAASRTP